MEECVQTMRTTERHEGGARAIAGTKPASDAFKKKSTIKKEHARKNGNQSSRRKINNRTQHRFSPPLPPLALLRGAAVLNAALLCY